MHIAPSTRWAVVLVLLITGTTAAQPSASRYQRELDRLRLETLLQAPPGVSADQRAFLDYGAYFTFDYLTVDDNLNENHVLRQYDAVAFARLNVDGVHEVFLRFRATYEDFNDGDSFDGRGDEFLDPDFDVAYYRFDLARYFGAYKGQEIDGNLVVKGGRDIVYWGNGLTLGQVIDGVTLSVNKGPFTVDAIAGVTPVRTVDFDASRPDFDFNTRRGFYGVMAAAQVAAHRPYVYGLMQRDYNKDETLDLGPVTTEFEYNSYYVAIGSSGNLGDRLVYGAEVVYQGGQTKSNSFTVSGPFLSPVEQTVDDISAFAADFRLDYLFPDTGGTRLTGEFLLASGDDDRLSTTDTFGGNAPNTTDRAFNGFGIINTGQAFAPAVSNLLMLRAGVSTYPFREIRALRRFQVGVDLFAYGKFDEDAPIDEPTQDERFLGWEPDFFLNWQVTSDVTLAMRYGVFFPNSDAFFEDDARHFFSTSVTVAF